jgi:hypothetical protein
VAKSGCCEVCLRLDGWYTAEEEPEPPYEIKQHDKCRCIWSMFTIDGLWRETREELISKHGDLQRGLDEAIGNIAFCDDEIATLSVTMAEQKENKETAAQAAAEYERRAEEAMNNAQEIMDNNEELTEDQQNQVDEYLLSAEDFLIRAQENSDLADSIQQEIFITERLIGNQEDLRDAAEYQKKEFEDKLLEVEPCLSLGCIEDKAEEIAGSRLILEF